MSNNRLLLNGPRPASSIRKNISDTTFPLNADSASTKAAPGQGAAGRAPNTAVPGHGAAVRATTAAAPGHGAAVRATTAAAPGQGAAARIQPTLDGGAFAYVANSGTNTVSVIDMDSFTKIKDIIAGTGPTAMDISPDGNYLYVVNRDGTMTIINTRNNNVTDTISLPIAPEYSSPTGVKASLDGKYVYVVYNGTAIVSIINAMSKQVIGTISLPDFGFGIDLTRDNYAYVTLRQSNSVAVVDLIANLVVKLICHVPCPENITIWKSESLAFVSNTRENSVSVLNTDLAVAAPETIPAYRWPSGIAIGPTSRRVYVALAGSDAIKVIDLPSASILPQIDINQSMPEGLAVTFDERYLLAANSGSGSLSFVNLTTNQVESSIATGAGASSVLIFEPQRIGFNSMQ